MGGSIEIDLYNVYEDPKTKEKDIMVKHASNQKQFIKLSKIMNTIVKTMKKKFDSIKQNISVPNGPIIVSFDNKNIITEEAQNIFWEILNKTLYNYQEYCGNINDICPWVQIINESTINYMNLSLEELNGKILIRGKEKRNKNNGTKTFIKPKINDNIFIHETQWFNITNTKINAFDQINKNKNLSESLSSFGCFGSKNKNIENVEIKHVINKNLILNSYHNLIRIYPNGIKIYSNNYDNYGFLLNGVQLLAINLQVLDKSWFINMALFNPSFHTKCYKKICKEQYIRENMLDVHAFVLKPYWLIGLSKYPQLYDIEIQITMPIKTSDVKYSVDKKHFNDDIYASIGNVKINTKFSNGICKLNLNGINVTNPILFINIKHKFSSYVMAVRLLWDDTKLSNNYIKIYPIKLNKKQILFHKYNNPTISKDEESCNNSDLMDIIKQIELEVKYDWQLSLIKDPIIDELNKHFENYNFTNITDLNKHKQNIINKISPIQSQLDISIDEDISDDENITKILSEKKISIENISDEADMGIDD
jgi:hypothetical protein